MEKNIISTQIRLSEEMHKQIKEEAKEMGVSFNSHLIELAWLGMKLRKSSLQVLSEPEHQ